VTTDGLASYNMADLAWPDIQHFVEGDGICLVPVGSMEMHGPHLPVGTDAFHALEVAERAAPVAGVPYTPVLWFGYSPHHLRGAGQGMGTITLRASTCFAVWYDIARSLIHHGFRKLVFISGHASNSKIMDPVMRKLRNEHGVLIAVYKPYGERYLGIMEGLLEAPPEETPGWHSSEQETSQMLAHDARFVHMERLDGWQPARAPEWMPSAFTKWDGTGDVVFKQHEYIYFPMEHNDFSPTGVIGNPALATAEKGEEIYDRFARYLVDAIEEVRKIEVGEIRSVEFLDRAL
jgi:creatinine amidohydrolase